MENITSLPLDEKIILILENGENKGEITYKHALSFIDDSESNLVKVGEKNGIKVCKIININKEKYKKQKSTHNIKTRTKEVKFGPNIASHDLDIKAKNIDRFLEDGDKVKLIFTRNRRTPVGSRTFDERCEELLKRVKTEYKVEGRTVADNSMCVLLSGKK